LIKELAAQICKITLVTNLERELNNEHLKSVIDTAIAFDDKEVIEHLAQSNLFKTAGIVDTLRSMGRGLQLQTRGMANESQFSSKSDLSSYLSSSTGTRDATECALILKWWVDSLKGLSGSAQVDVQPFRDPSDFSRGTQNISISFPNYANQDQIEEIFNNLSDDDVKKKYPFLGQVANLQGIISSMNSDIYTGVNNSPGTFSEVQRTPNGRQLWFPTGSSSPPRLGTLIPYTFVKISGDNSLLQEIGRLLSQPALSPKESEDVHVKIFSSLEPFMTDKAMTSMLRKNAIGGTQKAALDTNWKVIVQLPKLIEDRMKVPPQNPMEYKQKLQLKDYGRQLSQVLNTRITFTDENGLDRDEFLFNLPTLKHIYDDPNIQTQIRPLLAQVAKLLNLIQPELDKDTDLYRKYLTKLLPKPNLNKEVNTLY
jgi:hypothetical protein